MNLIPWKRSAEGEEKGTPSPLARWGREMNEMFERFWTQDVGKWMAGARAGEWAPAMDLGETDSEFHLHVEVPGMNPDDIDISLTGNTLTIRGSRRDRREDKGKAWHRVEQRSGSFQRTVTLPGGVDADKIRAAYDQGILEITLPKCADIQAKKISVKG